MYIEALVHGIHTRGLKIIYILYIVLLITQYFTSDEKKFFGNSVTVKSADICAYARQRVIIFRY